MEMKVITQDNCRYCHTVINFLNDREIEYTEINITDQPEAQVKHDIMGTPTVLLFDEDEEVARTSGPNFGDIETMINYME